MTYWNTTNRPANEVAARRIRATTQNDVILAHFAAHPMATPSQVQAATGMLICSVRRGITTLTKRGLLVKTTQFRVGPADAVEHVWALAA